MIDDGTTTINENYEKKNTVKIKSPNVVLYLCGFFLIRSYSRVPNNRVGWNVTKHL